LWVQGSEFQAIGCASDDDLIDCRISAELAAFYRASYSAFANTECVVVSAIIVFLPCFLLLRKIAEYESLRALVIVKITTLWLRLQSAAVSYGIAVCQRSFFSHHGAHPPDDRSQCHSGPFLGRVLQPQVAT
jgi:hypothetical protein